MAESKPLSKVQRQRKNKWKRPKLLKTCEKEITVLVDKPHGHDQREINSGHGQRQMTCSVGQQLGQTVSPLGVSSSDMRIVQQPMKSLERIENEREVSTLRHTLPMLPCPLTAPSEQSTPRGTSQHEPECLSLVVQPHESGHEEVIKSKLESIECQTFRAHFDQLLDAITDSDMLAAKLYTKHVISVDTLKEIKTEDAHAKTLTLLLAVQEQISFNPATKFREFVDVLNGDSSLHHLAYILDPKSDSCSSGPLEMTTSSTPVASDYQSSTTRLTERHHSVLCEYLNKHAAHWRTIGQYLGFLPGELDIIECKPTLIVGGPVAYLSEMIAKWLQWAPGDGRGSKEFATLEALKYILNKAGFGVTATELTSSVLLAPILNYSSRSIISSKSSEHQQQVVANMYQSHNIMTDTESVSKQEKVELQNLSEYDKYVNYLRDYYIENLVKQSDDKWPRLGVRKYIRLAVIINELKSMKDLNQFRESTIHGSIDDILESKAPLKLHEIFDLETEIISHCDGDNGDHTWYELYKIKKVLIEGAPGIGKSTMSYEICERWARGELFTYFSMVLLLKFRDKYVQDAKCLSDLFGVHQRNYDFQQRITHEIESTQGKGLMLILEGYDEAPVSLQTSQSIFLDLFTGKLLPKATVVITTRPSASSELRAMCQGDKSRRIEVLGFGNKEINEYIHSVFTEHETHNFKQYLELYPHIHSMMYVPLNSAIVTRVYQDCKSTSSIVPKTMTQLYSSLVRTLLMRYLREQPEHIKINIGDFADLPELFYNYFLRLCEIAFSGIMKAQTELIFSDLPSDFNTLGIMKSCPELYIDKGESYSYNFLHLTLQEFLAAYHISLFDKDKLEKEIEKLAGKPVVINFLVGLCQSKAHFWTTASKLIPVGVVSMSTLHLLFEAQDLSGFTVLEHDKLCFHTNSSMKPYDCYVLGSCIACSTSTCTWEIDFSKCEDIDYRLFVKGLVARSSYVKSTIILKNISDDGLCGLSDSELESTLTLKCLHIIANLKMVVSERGFQGFLKLLEKLSLEYLNVDQSKIRLSGAIQLAEVLISNCTLKHLELNENDIQDEGIIHLAKALCINFTLKYFRLTNNLVENEGATFLAKALEMNSTLEHLDLSGNAIQNEGAVHLAKALEKNSTLKYFDLSDNAIQNDGAVHLVKALEKNFTLEYLDLSDNVIQIQNERSRHLAKANFSLNYLRLSYNSVEDNDAICLAKVIEMNSTLEHLDLGDNEIQNEGAVHLAIALEKNSTLKYLDLSDNVIQNKGAIHLAKALKINSTLCCLNLSGNAIQNEGAIHLAKALEKNSTLICLDLSGNAIQDKGAIHLAQAMEINSTLCCLDLSGNEVQNEGAIHLAKALERTLALKCLHLSGNAIQTEGAFHLANALEKNSTLEHLNFSCNAIQAEGSGAIYVAKALETNSSLIHLDLSGNAIQNEAIIHLAKALEINSTLIHLDLSGNEIQNEGAIHLAKALEINSTLEHLNLSGNAIQNEGAICLAKTLEQNSTLRHLDLSDNTLQDEGAIHLVEVLAKNFTLECLNLSDNAYNTYSELPSMWIRHSLRKTAF